MARPVRLAYAWLGAGAFVASLLYFLYFYLIELDWGEPAGGLSAFLIDAALFSVFALHHSVMARSRAKRWLTRAVPPELERTTYVWIASLLFLATCLAWRRIGGEWYHVTGAGALVLGAVQALGMIMTLVATAELRPLELAGVRQAQGESADPQGSPAADVPALRTTGAYAWVRHPVYFGWVLVVFGAPHMTGDRAAFATLSTAYLVIAVPFEERSLVELFGDAYREYVRQVRWKMIPGLY